MSRMDKYHGNDSGGKRRRNTEMEVMGKNSKKVHVTDSDVGGYPKGKKSKLNKKTKKKKKGRFLRKFLALVFLTILGIGGFIVYEGLTTGLIKDPFGVIQSKTMFNDGKVNILVLGADKRPGEDVSRSDVIMVASVDFKMGTANLISVPRDTRLDIPGYGTDKINHAYAYGGKELVDETLEEFLDITIDRTVEINFATFADAIDKVGGVKIDVPYDMYKADEEIDLVAGEGQLLNGHDALAFVRYRDTPRGDLDRVQNQQTLLKALALAVKESGSVFTQMDVLQGIFNDLETNVTLEEMLYMFSAYKDLPSFTLTTWTAPGTPDMIDGVSYVIPDDDAPEQIRGFLDGSMVPVLDPETETKILIPREEADAIIEDGQSILMNLPLLNLNLKE